MGRLTLIIATPERLIVQTEVDEVMAPAPLGYFGALPAHTPFLSQLKSGEVVYRIGKKKHLVWIKGGYCEVLEDRVTILANKAKKIEESKGAEEPGEGKGKLEAYDYKKPVR